MSFPQGLAAWPAVKQLVSYSGALSLGITPSVHRLTFAPQTGSIPGNGNLVLTYGGTTIRFRDCLVDSASYQFNESGYLVSFNIMDRRWKWRYGHISGNYNVRREDGSIINGALPAAGLNPFGGGQAGKADEKAPAYLNSERTPQQLAKLCLEAMGESGYSVSALPNDARPAVEWEYANPAQALQELCDQFGCRLALGLDNKVRIVRLGKGANMPDGPIIDDQLLANPPERPDHVIVITAPIMHQVDLELEAVGLDTDGTIKTIDKLSYKPAAGFLDPPKFASVTAGEKQNLARASVYRWYRIKTPFTLAGQKITDLKQILPIDDKQVMPDQATRDRMPAQVYGIFYSERAGGSVATNKGNTAASQSFLPLGDTKSNLIYKETFTIDRDRGIVQFGSPVFRNSAGSPGLTIAAAQLRLRVAVPYREKTGAFKRIERSRATPGKQQGTGPLVIVKDEILPAVITTYTDTFQVKKAFANNAVTDKECDYYLDAALAAFQVETPHVRTFAGWIPVSPDGALQTVSWQCSERGATMVVSRGQDLGSETTIPYKHRRLIEKQQAGQAGGDFDKKAAVQAAKLRRSAKVT
jgi:hypothetical protein